MSNKINHHRQASGREKLRHTMKRTGQKLKAHRRPSVDPSNSRMDWFDTGFSEQNQHHA